MSNKMNKISLELSPIQIKKLVEKLPLKEKIKLVNKLEKETLPQRWDEILKDVDKRLQRFPVSEQEIAQEIAEYRKRKHVKSNS